MIRAYFILLVFSFLGFNASAQFTVIPDTAFEQELIDQGIDSDGMVNGLVETEDIINLETLSISHNPNITSLLGLQDFQSLEDLSLLGLGISEISLQALGSLKSLVFGGMSSGFTTLDLSENINLENVELTFISENFMFLDISENENLKSLDLSFFPNIESIDLTNLVSLETLEIDRVLLNAIDLNSNIALKSLRLREIPITELNLNSNTLLESLRLFNTLTDVASEPSIEIPSLDLSNNTQLREIDIYNLLLPSFDVSELSQLETLSIVYNGFTTLDLSNNAELRQLITGISNPPEFFPNTNNISSLEFCQNPNLENISLFDSGLEVLNLKNGNNGLLQNVNIAENPDLQIVNVDDATGAMAGDAPYGNWITDVGIQYSDSGMQCNLSVEDITSQDILVVPNPFHNALNIMSKVDAPLSIKVYSIHGNLIYENNNLQGSINASLWQSGLYIVEINEHNSTRHYIKIFKE